MAKRPEIDIAFGRGIIPVAAVRSDEDGILSGDGERNVRSLHAVDPEKLIAVEIDAFLQMNVYLAVSPFQSLLHDIRDPVKVQLTLHQERYKETEKRRHL